MNVNLVKWGNSVAIRIPKTILEQLNIDSTNIENISFNITVKGNKLFLIKKQNKTKFEILAKQARGEKLNPKANFNWGKPVGKEEW